MGKHSLEAIVTFIIGVVAFWWFVIEKPRRARRDLKQRLQAAREFWPDLKRNLEVAGRIAQSINMLTHNLESEMPEQNTTQLLRFMFEHQQDLNNAIASEQRYAQFIEDESVEFTAGAFEGCKELRTKARELSAIPKEFLELRNDIGRAKKEYNDFLVRVLNLLEELRPKLAGCTDLVRNTYLRCGENLKARAQALAAANSGPQSQDWRYINHLLGQAQGYLFDLRRILNGEEPLNTDSQNRQIF